MKDVNAAMTPLEKMTRSTRVLVRPLNIKGKPRHDRSHVTLIAQLVQHCTGDAKVVGSNPVQSLNFFRSFFQYIVVSWLHSHVSFFHHFIATVGHLLLLDSDLLFLLWTSIAISLDFRSLVTSHEIRLDNQMFYIAKIFVYKHCFC